MALGTRDHVQYPSHGSLCQDDHIRALRQLKHRLFDQSVVRGGVAAQQGRQRILYQDQFDLDLFVCLLSLSL